MPIETPNSWGCSPGDQRERQRAVAGAEPHGAPGRAAWIRSELRRRATTSTVFSDAGAALGQQVAVGAGPGLTITSLASSSLGCARQRTPRPNVYGRSTVPTRVESRSTLTLAVGADRGGDAERSAEIANQPRARRPTPGVGQLGRLRGDLVGRVGEGAARAQPVGAGDDVEGAARRSRRRSKR